MTRDLAGRGAKYGKVPLQLNTFPYWARILCSRIYNFVFGEKNSDTPIEKVVNQEASAGSNSIYGVHQDGIQLKEGNSDKVTKVPTSPSNISGATESRGGNIDSPKI